MIVSTDPEPSLIAHLAAELPDPWGRAVLVRNNLPADYRRTDAPLLLVRLDGTPTATWPIETNPTFRLVAYANDEPTAKALCRLAQAVAIAHPGGDGVGKVSYLIGPFPAEDPTTGAQIASATVRVKAANQIA